MTLCFICKEMASRKRHQSILSEPSSMITEQCLLCGRQFCTRHRSNQHVESVCEVNHATYYARHRQLPGIYPSMEARERALGRVEEK
ncbi:hypothetical protein BJX64DRAFT_263848 [Aspergillus heterothallicus]